MVLEDFLRPAECDELMAAGVDLTKNLPDGEQRAVFSTTQSEKQVCTQFTHSQDEYLAPVMQSYILTS